MAVIGVKSITGITSITNAAGGADVLTFHSNNTTERVRIDSNGYLSFAGDTNTYIWHPSADQLAITRAGGSFPMIRFGSGGGGGTIAIGNTTANLVTNSEILSVRGYSSFKSVNNNYAAIYTHNEGNTSGTYNAHILWNAGGANRGGIGYMPNNGEVIINNHQALIFATGATQFGGTERLKIYSGGQIGIRNTNATSFNTGGDDLVIGNATDGQDAGITLYSHSSDNGSIFFNDTADTGLTGLIQYRHSEDAMRFITNTLERLRIDSSGCVRVGNTATQTTSGNTKRIALGAKGGIQGWVSGQLNGLIQLTDNYYWDGSNNKAIEADHCAYLSLRSGTLRFGSTNSSQTAGQNVSGGIHERFRITSDGHVLFSGLTTKNDTRNSKGITIKSSSGGGGISFQNYGSNGSRNWRIRPDDMAGWGNLDFAVSPTANSSTDWPDHAHDVVMSLHPDRCIDTGQKTITGGNNLVIQNFRVKGIWSGSPSIGKSIEMISGYDGSVKMAAIGYNLTDTATGSTYGGDLTLHTQPLYSSPTTPLPVRMRVSSSGYVTTPQNPKFWYSSLSNTSSSGGTSNTEILKFATERHNQGSNYNTSNGRFTAPVAGTYWFSFNGLVDNSGSNSHYWAQLWRNGSQVTNIGYTFSNNGEYEYFGGSACIYLAKDDYAQIYASANIHDGNETSFSGFLIG